MNPVEILLNRFAELGELAGEGALPLGLTIGVAGLFVLLQGFFAGYETGVVSANRVRLDHLVEAGSRTATVYSRLVRRRDRVLTLTLVGTNIALVCATVLTASQIGKFWTTVFLTPVALIFGEIIAKSIFRRHATRLVLLFVYPMRTLYVALFPVVACATAFANRLLLSLTGKSWQETPALTREELRLVFLEGAESGAIEPAEREMIHSVMDLSTTLVKEIMVPRTRMVAVDGRATQRDLVSLFQQSGHSRMPVYDRRIDNIIGIVNVFDVIKGGLDDHDDNIGRFIRPAYYVPDTKRVGELLQELRANRIHMAIVVDEYGGTDGIVTLEDVVEEIFGEIQDEYDAEPASIQRIGENCFLVGAELDLEEANEVLGLELPDEDAETIGGFVLNAVGRIPASGETMEYGNARFTVMEADEHSISKIKVEIAQEAEDAT